jgi:hypothetical protein
MTTQTFEIFLACNEDGDYALSAEGPTEATETLRDEWGGETSRVVKLMVTMSLPTITEVPVTVADEPAEAKAEAA